MEIDLEFEGNQLTLDQLNDLKMLAKQLVPDGSVKTLINQAVDQLAKKVHGSQCPLPFFTMSQNLLPCDLEVKTNIKRRALYSRCNVRDVLHLVEPSFSVIHNQVMITDDNSMGGSITLQPKSQLGSFVYVLVLDYAFNYLNVLGQSAFISIDNYRIQSDYTIIYFDDKFMADGTLVRTSIDVLIREGKKPITGSTIINKCRVSVPIEHETVEMVLQRGDLFFKSQHKPKINYFSHDPTSTGMIDSNSLNKSQILEDDDFER